MVTPIPQHYHRTPLRATGTDRPKLVRNLSVRRLANLDRFLTFLRDAERVRFHSERRQQLRRLRGAATGAQAVEAGQSGPKDATPSMMISRTNALLAIGPDLQLLEAIKQLINDLSAMRGRVTNYP